MNPKIYLLTLASLIAFILVILGLNTLKKKEDLEESSSSQHRRTWSASPTPSRPSRERKTSDRWTLPFHVSQRLSEEQRVLLKSNPEEALTTAWTSVTQEQWAQQQHLLVAWAGRDPEAAMQWVSQHVQTGQSGAANLFAALAAGQLIHSGPEAMQRFISRYDNAEQLTPKQQGKLEEYTYGLLGKADTIEAAMASIQTSKNGVLAGAIVGGIDGSNQKMAAIDYMEAKGVKIELNYWNLQQAARENPRIWADWAVKRDSELLPELIQSWSRQDQGAAKTWLKSSLPADDPRLQSVLELID